eukprot:ANDGO_03602.mRNA.1 Coiled-coil protein
MSLRRSQPPAPRPSASSPRPTTATTLQSSSIASRSSAASKPSGAPTLRSDGELHKEYITNLQQQIYFLELELKLMKDKATAPGPPLKSRSTETHEDIELSEAANLDDAIYTLKTRYVEREKMFRRDFEDLSKAKDATEESLRAETERSARLDFERKAAVSALESEKNVFAGEKDRLLAEIVAVEKKLEDAVRKIGGLESELQKADTDRQQREVELSTVKTAGEISASKAAELEARASQRESELAKKSEEARMLAEQLKDFTAGERKIVEADEALAKEVKDLKSEIRKLTLEKKHLDLEIERLREVNSRLQTDHDGLLERNTDLSTRQRELDTAVERLSVEVAKARDDTSRAIAEGKDAVEKRQSLEEEIRSLGAENAVLKAQMGTYEKKSAEAFGSAKLATETMERMAREKENDAEHVAATESENAELRKTVRVLTEENGKMGTKLAALEEALQEKESALAKLRVRHEKAEKKLQVSKQLDDMQLREFQNLMSTNLQVAAQIQELVSKVQEAPSALKKKPVAKPVVVDEDDDDEDGGGADGIDA